MAQIFKRQMERLCQLFCWRVSQSNLLINEKGSDTTYAQINAKLVDYDVRFRNQSNSPQSSKSPSVTTNAFSQRRESFKNQVSQQNSSSFDNPSLTHTPINTSHQLLLSGNLLINRRQNIHITKGVKARKIILNNIIHFVYLTLSHYPYFHFNQKLHLRFLLIFHRKMNNLNPNLLVQNVSVKKEVNNLFHIPFIIYTFLYIFLLTKVSFLTR